MCARCWSDEHAGGRHCRVMGRRAGTIEGMRRLPTPPLWIFGIYEAVQAIVATALLVALPVLGFTLARSFSGFDLEAVGTMAAQAWMVVHAAPLNMGDLGGEAASGWFHLVPLGFTLIPFLLAWRAGRRLAQGAYPDQLWQGLLALTLSYAAAGVGLAVFADGDPGTQVWTGVAAGTLVGVGSLCGCYAEARSATRMIGVDLEAQVEKYSQELKWAGAYLWAVLRAGAVAAVAAVGLSALLLAGWLGSQWMQIANAYQQTDAGLWGDIGLTLLHLGLAPNAVLWALSYAAGPGISMGAGSPVGPFSTELGAVPEVPLLAALPHQAHAYAPAVLALVLLAGAAAGWWLMREGENHFDDWCQLKLRFRAASLTLSTLTLGVLTGLVTAALLIGPLWLSHSSLGVGRMNDVGPHAGIVAGLIGAWVALGVMLGYLLAPATALSRRR